MGENESSQTQQPAWFRDARGRRVTLLDPYEMNLLRHYDQIPAETLKLIAAEVGFGLPKGQRHVYLTFVLVFLGTWCFLGIWKIIRRSGFDLLATMYWIIHWK